MGGAARGAFGPGFRPMFAAGVELGLADDAVVIGVETLEAGVGAFGPAGLGGGAHFLAADGAVTFGVRGGEALDAGVDEFGPAQTLVAIGVGAQGGGLGAVRGLLGDGDAPRRKGQGGQSAHQKSLSHVDVSMAARRGRMSLSGE